MLRTVDLTPFRLTNNPLIMTRTSLDIARSAAANLEKSAGRGAGLSALVGFDGFIDAIIDVVDQRTDMSPAGYSRMKTIGQFANRAGAAAGKSTNMEMVVKEERWGGNGPLMAGALARLGAPVTYIGAVAQREGIGQLHPLYAELGRRCRKVVPLAAPAHTDALEFDDGKIMLGKPRAIQSVNWARLVQVLGMDGLVELVRGSALIGIVNWVMMGGVESIWEGLTREVFPKLSGDLPPPLRRAGGPAARRRVFIDLCDPAKRTDADVLRAMGLLKAMNEHVSVTLGLNLAEAERIAQVLGVRELAASRGAATGPQVLDGAAAIRAKAGLSCVAIHPREGAAAADAQSAAWIDGPFTATPKLSTGAGDHFNGGFAFAQALGLPLDECLGAGVATSGAYVRDAESPTLERLVAFLRDLPAPQKV